MDYICDCVECKLKNKIYVYQLHDTFDKPFQIIQNGQILEPLIKNQILNIPSSNITLLLNKYLLFQGLKELDISNNPLRWISGITSLIKLNCSNCLLNELPNCYELPNLLYLNCSNNKIKNIHFPKLKKLECNNCLVDDLQCGKLEYLSCSGNPITSINIPTLQYLEAYNCPLIIIHYIPGLYKRSSVIDYSKSKNVVHLINKKEYIDLSYQLINWQNNKCKLDIKLKLKNNILFSKVSNYLFY